MIGIIAPIFLTCIFLFTIIFLIFRKWLISIILLIICTIVNWHIEYLTMHFSALENNNDNYLTIATNNIYSQGEYLDSCRHRPDSLYLILKKTRADVIVIQEYDSIRCCILTELLAKDGYKLYQKNHSLVYGENAIYSRLLLRNIRFDLNGFMMMAELLYCGRIIGLFNCHLCSNNINEKILNNNGEANWIKRLPEYMNSIMKTSKKREAEAIYLRQKIDSCLKQDIPVIVAGDMNDVGGNRAIKIIEGCGNVSLRDAWWRSGRGIGNTYHGYGLLLFRLDHIFYSNHFKSLQSQVVEQPFSDHNILITKLKFK